MTPQGGSHTTLGPAGGLARPDCGKCKKPFGDHDPSTRPPACPVAWAQRYEPMQDEPIHSADCVDRMYKEAGVNVQQHQTTEPSDSDCAGCPRSDHHHGVGERQLGEPALVARRVALLEHALAHITDAITDLEACRVYSSAVIELMALRNKVTFDAGFERGRLNVMERSGYCGGEVAL